MGFKLSTISAVIALLTSISAIYNSFLLRGGKLAWSEIFIALGMISLTVSFVLPIYFPDLKVILGYSASDVLFILGLLILLLASLRVRFSLKS